MIAIVDYGVGNLFSLKSSLSYIGAEAVITRSAAEIDRCDKILLPGVGAFQDAVQKLRAGGLDNVIQRGTELGKPLLGICLGMQLLFDKSLEFGEHAGLGLVPGCVVPIKGAVPADLKIPHIGWNGLIFPKSREKHALFQYVNEGDCVYFVHSYYAADCAASTIAAVEYGAALTAAVARDNVVGVQFHPEKSGQVGLNILRAFCAM